MECSKCNAIILILYSSYRNMGNVWNFSFARVQRSLYIIYIWLPLLLLFPHLLGVPIGFRLLIVGFGVHFEWVQRQIIHESTIHFFYLLFCLFVNGGTMTKKGFGKKISHGENVCNIACRFLLISIIIVDKMNECWNFVQYQYCIFHQNQKYRIYLNEMSFAHGRVDIAFSVQLFHSLSL